jgi:hypothetical protein
MHRLEPAAAGHPIEQGRSEAQSAAGAIGRRAVERNRRQISDLFILQQPVQPIAEEPMVCTTRRWRELDSNSQSQALCLHHFYRAMAWLGETVEEASEASSAPRCVEDVIEERLFARRRDLLPISRWCSWTPPACRSKATARRCKHAA